MADSEYGVEEYRALRATIRERGTLRLLVTALTFVAWAIVVAVLESLGGRPALSLAALIVLAAGFEVVFAAHVGVERIGRYVQVRYERAQDGPAWEDTAMRLGRDQTARVAIDPLFAALFTAGALINLVALTPIAAILMGSSISGTFSFESFVAVAVHAVFIARVLQARAIARRQRARDLDALTRLLTPPPAA